MLARLRPLALLAGLTVAPVARADRREVYALVGYEAGASHYTVPAVGTGGATAYTGALDLTVFYGLTNFFHLGGRLFLSRSSDIDFRRASVLLPDGSQSTGDVYANHSALGLGVLALYRLDTGRHLAPVLELEGGFTLHEYNDVAQVPAGASYFVPLPNTWEAALHGSGTVLVEYRFASKWVALAGLGVRLEASGENPWSVFIPVRIGRVW